VEGDDALAGLLRPATMQRGIPITRQQSRYAA